MRGLLLIAVSLVLGVSLLGCGGDDKQSSSGKSSGSSSSQGATAGEGTSGEEKSANGSGASGTTGSGDKSGSSKETEAERRKLPKRVVYKPKTNTKKYKPVVKVKLDMTKDDVLDLGRPFTIRRADSPPGATECWFYRDLKGSVTMVCFDKGKVSVIQTFPRKSNQKK